MAEQKPKQETTHDQDGTYLKPDDAAWIYNEQNGFSLLLPEKWEDEANIPLGIALIAACVMLAENNPEWVRFTLRLIYGDFHEAPTKPH